MASASFVVTLSGATSLATSTGFPTNGAVEKGGWSFVSIQALGTNTGVVYVGGAYPGAALSSTGAYGFRIEVPATSIPPAPTVVELGRGNVSLEEIWVKGGNGDKVSVHCIG
jgi:hypothetical protein